MMVVVLVVVVVVMCAYTVFCALGFYNFDVVILCLRDFIKKNYLHSISIIASLELASFKILYALFSFHLVLNNLFGLCFKKVDKSAKIYNLKKEADWHSRNI